MARCLHYVATNWAIASLLIWYGFLLPNPLSSGTSDGVVPDASRTGIAIELTVLHVKSLRLSHRKPQIHAAGSSLHYVMQAARWGGGGTASIARRSGVAHSWGSALLVTLITWYCRRGRGVDNSRKRKRGFNQRCLDSKQARVNSFFLCSIVIGSVGQESPPGARRFRHSMPVVTNITSSGLKAKFTFDATPTVRDVRACREGWGEL